MNSDIIKILSKEKENALNNQNERKIQENIKMQDFLEKAKRNAKILNNEIFKTISKAFIESKKGQEDVLFEFFYENIGYPKAIIEGNTQIGSSSRRRILDKLMIFTDEEELQLAQKYNECNYKNQVVFLL